MNNENFLIEENCIELAKDVCKYITNPEVRNRAAANVLAAKISKEYFQDYDVDTESGLHNIFQVLNDIEISDIYVQDSYFDVRLYFNENELSVPKSHFDNELLPLAYMFIKLDEELSGGYVTGFLTPSAVDKSKNYNGYYKVKEDELLSFYDVESQMVSVSDIDLPENLDSLIFDYLDGRIEDKNAFYKLMLNSEEARKLLANAAKAQNVFNFVSVADIQPSQSVEQSNNQSVAEDSPSLDLSDDTLEPFDMNESLELNLDEPALVEEFAGGLEEDSLEVSEMNYEDTITLEESSEGMLQMKDVSEDDLLMESNSVQQVPVAEGETSEKSPEEEFEIRMAGALDNIGLVSNENNAYDNFLAEPEVLEEVSEMDMSAGIDVEPQTLVIDEASEEVGEVNDVPVEHESALSNDVERELQESTVDENEPESFEYSTSVTPSIDTIEDDSEQQNLEIENLEEFLEEESEQEQTFDEEVLVEDDNVSQIDTLFNQDSNEEEQVVVKPAKKGSKLLPLAGTVVLLAGLAYFGYTKFMNPELPAVEPQEQPQSAVNTDVQNVQQEPAVDAMPVETVENVEKPLPTNEGTSVAIPAIEQNLDASILVSNLSVNWEVPAGYINNNAAKRYFTKMGKVIQLNLKTELLLLSKPPITNKIALELQFDKGKQKFEIKGITASSGEKTVDDLITKTVEKVLDMNLSINTSSFANTAGNPILVIRL